MSSRRQKSCPSPSMQLHIRIYFFAPNPMLLVFKPRRLSSCRPINMGLTIIDTNQTREKRQGVEAREEERSKGLSYIKGAAL